MLNSKTCAVAIAGVVAAMSVSSAHADSIRTQPKPITKPFSTNVMNITPPDWEAVIRAVTITLYYDDGTTEEITDQQANVASGQTKSYRAVELKCVAKERVSFAVYDRRGEIHVFDKWNTTAPNCLEHADSILGKA